MSQGEKQHHHSGGPPHREGPSRAMVQAMYLNRISDLEGALRSIVEQCDNVIFNASQRSTDNDSHLRSWRSVRDFAWRHASKQ